MKTTILLCIFMTFFASCAIQNNGNEYVRIYKQAPFGDMGGPSYLVLRESGYYELHDPLGDTSYFGSFKVSNDTLCIYPLKYGYYHKEHRIWEEESTSEVSFSSIPSYYNIKRNKLINITDYGQYPELEEWIPDIIKADYIMVK